MPREGLSLKPKHFVVFAERFEHGAWKYWEHECDKEEIPALEDSAIAYAFQPRAFKPTLVYRLFKRGRVFV